MSLYSGRQKFKNTTILYEPFDPRYAYTEEGLLKSTKRKSPVNLAIYRTLCGERGIRTPGTSRYAGFQDRCIRPLYHLSKLSPNNRFVIGFWSKSECKVRDNN